VCRSRLFNLIHHLNLFQLDAKIVAIRPLRTVREWSSKMPESLCELYARLRRDPNRETLRGFSEDIVNTNIVLHDRFVRDPERREALECWLQGNHQPCLFGRLAAKRNGIDYCFLTVDDLAKSDDHVQRKIATARRLWKNRALRGEPRHGFLLSICDEKVALAAPDEALRRFAIHLQNLAGWIGRPDVNDNDIVDEWLYLKNPKTREIVKYTFSVDFFATAGDKRWWHDHRIPGGMAFTANSLGHMVRHQEWHEDRNDRIEWALRTAMLTIESAAKNVPHGPATRLRDETYGPLKPYAWTGATKPSDKEKLRGKDCGSYEGFLHTDHAIRGEFFDLRDVPAFKETPYSMDFTYIYDSSSNDYLPFMVGEPVTEAQVEQDIGRPGDMRVVEADVESGVFEEPPPSCFGSRVEEALAHCRQWKLTDNQENELL
jgi:hypothetical protein